MKQKEVIHERIAYLGGKWVLGKRENRKRNFEFVSQGETPAQAFNGSAYTAGVGKDIIFDIKIFLTREG